MATPIDREWALPSELGLHRKKPFANIFMSKLERKMLSECVLKPWFWWRFLDDVFFIWLHGRNTLIKFLEYVNSFHQNIKYTWSFSKNLY